MGDAAFILTKIFTHLTYPLSVSLILILASGVCVWRTRRKQALVLLSLGVAWIWLWSSPLFSEWVVRELENEYPALRIKDVPTADAIVVLGGSVMPQGEPWIYTELNARGDRIIHGFRLFNNGKASRVIVSGGPNTWSGERIKPESEIMRELLMELGIPEEALIAETRSRNTKENALFVSEICKEKGFNKIILITSAMHMPRAMKEFQHSELYVHPCPVDFEAPADVVIDYPKLIPTARALENGTAAFHERLGMLVQSIRGAFKR